MGRPDASAAAALEQSVIRPRWVGWLDIIGEPVRVTTAPYPVTFAGTGDPDLDGYTFGSVGHQLIDISEVQHKEGGSDTVLATLSGLMGIDSDMMTQLGDAANFQGRVARLWVMMYDETLHRIGKPWPYYTGYMSAPKFAGDADSQTIILSIESYLATLNQASGRTYLSQSDYDAGDRSADASIAIANGTTGAALGSGGGSPYPTNVMQPWGML